MRVIAGKHRGRVIRSKEDANLRPTSGMAREAVFNILVHGDFYGDGRSLFEDCVVLDAFCGTGALGIESLSRGAAHVFFMDKNGKHLEIARENIEYIGEKGNATFVCNDSAFPPKAKRPCNLIFLDPPYDSKLVIPTLERLEANGWLAPQAVVVAEMNKNEPFEPPVHFSTLKARHYGKTGIYILQWQKVDA